MEAVRAVFISVVIFMLISCVPGVKLHTRHLADAPGLAGGYTLILYDGGSYHRYDTLAVLDPEGDGYRILPSAPEFDYRIVRGLAADVALQKAEHFVGMHPEFLRAHMSEITGDAGNPVGYEIRPLYLPVIYGQSDLLDVVYLLGEEGADGVRTVRVIVRVKPIVEDVERLIEGKEK
jgi:hypothetical protein